MKFIDGHDDAYIGVAAVWKNQMQIDIAVYSGEKIIAKLMEHGMDETQAIEFCAFNIEGAFVGDDTPIIVWNLDLNEANETYATLKGDSQ